ncbi:peptide chain release factor 1, partial [Actinotalea fermentans ATCC 43279 = JCM 9966 = DSM 3133]
MTESFAAVEHLLAEHAEIETLLADPAVHADAGRARTLGRRYAELGQVVAAYRAWRDATDDAETAAELASEDS